MGPGWVPRVSPKWAPCGPLANSAWVPCGRPTWGPQGHPHGANMGPRRYCWLGDWLPVLSSIAPADIRREVATSRTILRARGKPELLLLTDIDFHPRPRLKSRQPCVAHRPTVPPGQPDIMPTRGPVSQHVRSTQHEQAFCPHSDALTTGRTNDTRQSVCR